MSTFAVMRADGSVFQSPSLSGARGEALRVLDAEGRDAVPVLKDGSPVGEASRMGDVPVWSWEPRPGVPRVAAISDDGRLDPRERGRKSVVVGKAWFRDVGEAVSRLSETGVTTVRVRLPDGSLYGILQREELPELGRENMEVGPMMDMWFFKRYDGRMCSYLPDGAVDMTFADYDRVRLALSSRESAREFAVRHTPGGIGGEMFDRYMEACTGMAGNGKGHIARDG